MKPTALTPLPKPEFIANVDTANEEIVRLAAQYNVLIAPDGRLTLAEAAVEDLTAKLDTATTTAANAQAAQETATVSLATVTAQNLELKKVADTAASAATTAIAAAGIQTPAAVANGDPLKDTKSATDGLTGVARAIAANVELQKPKS